MFAKKTRYYLKQNSALPYVKLAIVNQAMSETLGDLIRRRMKETGIKNNAELARRLGLSASYVGDLINDVGKTKAGKYIPSPAIVSNLAKHLHIAESDILATIGYDVGKFERVEILDGVTLQFDQSCTLTDAEKKTIMSLVETMAAGVKAKRTSNDTT